MSRYHYLRNKFGGIENPFDKGSFQLNVIDALFPSNKDYYTREEVTRDKMLGYMNEDEQRRSLLSNQV